MGHKFVSENFTCGSNTFCFALIKPISVDHMYNINCLSINVVKCVYFGLLAFVKCVLAVCYSCCRLNPTSVLDFVGACRQIPKIWQGRELKAFQVR